MLKTKVNPTGINKIIKTICAILIGIFMVFNLFMAARTPADFEIPEIEGYEVITTSIKSTNNIIERFIDGVTFGNTGGSGWNEKAKEGDILIVTVGTNRFRFNGNSVNFILTSPDGTSYNTIFTKSHKEETVELNQTGTWTYRHDNAYADAIVITLHRKIEN